jgi:hypothetical protein
MRREDITQFKRMGGTIVALAIPVGQTAQQSTNPSVAFGT